MTYERTWLVWSHGRVFEISRRVSRSKAQWRQVGPPTAHSTFRVYLVRHEGKTLDRFLTLGRARAFVQKEGIRLFAEEVKTTIAQQLLTD